MKKFIKLKKILIIVSLSKNLDIKFFDCILKALKPIYPKNLNKITKILENQHKDESNFFIFSLLFICVNILNTNLLYKNYKYMLTHLNQETSIFEINRHNFSRSKPELLKKEFEFELQKELYYTKQQRQKFMHHETILRSEIFNSIKYL